MDFVNDGSFYRSLVEDANDMIAVFGNDGTILHVNAASERLIGFTPAQGIGTNIVDYLHPGELERALYTISQMDANPLGLANGSYLLHHADGSWVPTDITAHRVTHDGQELVVVSCRFSVAPRIEREVLMGLLNRASLLDVMTPVLDSVAWQELGSHVAISWSGADAWHHVDTGIPEDLCGSAGLEPWAGALCDGNSVVGENLDALPTRVRSLAEQCGFDEYWIEPVSIDNGEQRALITIWTSQGRSSPRIHELGMASAKSYVAVILQFTSQRQLLDHAASHDPLTGLSNRKALVDAMHRTPGGGAILFCDLDYFKPMNDRFGHAFGDALLTAVAARLRGCVRPSDVTARIGGDEFVIMCPALTTAGTEALAMRIQESLSRPFTIDGEPIEIGVSIGLVNADAFDANLIARADQAMYDAKAAGRGVCRWATEPAS